MKEQGSSTDKYRSSSTNGQQNSSKNRRLPEKDHETDDALTVKPLKQIAELICGWSRISFKMARYSTFIKYARSTLEERLDVIIVYSNERRTFCIFLVIVRNFFWPLV